MKSLLASILIGTARLLGLSNRYEGAVRFSESRSWIPAMVQDARFDADSATRWELVRKTRYFERNSGLLNRLTDLFEQFTVGANGLQFIPSSSDEEWNTAAQVWWDGWCKLPDLTSRQNLGTIMSLAARRWFIDGEVFIIKSYGEEIVDDKTNRTIRRPRIQLIEAHRVQTPAQFFGEEGVTIIDGIRIDKRGRPIGYFVRMGVADDSFSYIEADRMIHIFEPIRPGEYRGVPFASCVLNDLHDLDDLQILEMAAAKENAAVTRVLENASGEYPTAQGMMQRMVSVPTQNSSGEEVEETRTQFMQRLFGKARGIALKLGEKLTEFRSERPSVAVQQFWDYITNKVCAGVGISKLLVFPTSVQGTVARADYDVQAGFFRSRSAILVAGFTEVYLFAMDWAVKNDVTVSDPPEDWRNVETCPPRAVNVDVGRNSAAMLAELDAGCTTYRDVYAQLGKNWRTEIRQRAREEAYINRIAEEEKVSAARIRKAVAESIAAAPSENGGANAEQIKQELDSYGVGVRAGAITPNDQDESHFRSKLGLPQVNENVTRAWSEDKGVRRPITLVGLDGQLGEVGKVAQQNQPIEE